jgi:hypothetical protein
LQLFNLQQRIGGILGLQQRQQTRAVDQILPSLGLKSPDPQGFKGALAEGIKNRIDNGLISRPKVGTK